MVAALGGRLSRFAWAVLLGLVSLQAWAEPPRTEPPRVEPPRAPQPDDLEADILLGAARNAVQRGDLNTGIQRFREFQERYSNREDGLREYADALFQANRAGEAAAVYERLLKAHPNDAPLIRTLVDAMLNTGNHPRAKSLLTDAVAWYPDRVDFALSLALLYTLDDETSKAEELIRTSIAGRPLTTDRMRLDAASLYIQLRRAADAGPIIAELQNSMPDDPRALALSVRYALLVGDRSKAIRLADKLDRLYPGNIGLRLELASALYAAGSYAEAGRLFGDVLHKSPKNTAALLGCARVAMRNNRIEQADDYLDAVPTDVRGRTWQLAAVERDTIVGNYLRAHQILDRLLEENPDDSRALMAIADLNRAENEFIKADARYRAYGADADNSAAGRQLAVSLFLQYRYCDAERLCRRLLATDPTDAATAIVLARILVKTDRWEEAVDLVRRTQQTDNNAFPECIYFSRFVSPDFGPCKGDESRPLFLAATLYDLGMGDGRRQWAKQVLDEALQADPNNVILRTRLAEWHASFGVPSHAACAAEIYEELLAREPSNQKWLLGLARANVTLRCYDRALAIYRRLRCESPDQYLYARETARVVFFVCGSPYGLAEYDATLCDWSGLEEEARRIAEERFAKATCDSSPSLAAGAYEKLLALEPYEPHIAFELGQVRGHLGTTCSAIDAYTHLLAANPNHRDAQVALEGKRLEQCRELLADHRFVRERGRDGLTSIDRLGEFVAYQFPRDDENEHFSLGYGRLSLAPTYGAGTTGDALTFRFQKQLCADLGPWLSPYVPMAVFVDGELQRYDRYVSTRPVFEAGVKLHSCDDLVWTVSGTMQNVLENGESLQQDIYRGGLRTDLIYKPCNYWETEATYEFQAYSDVNTRNAAEFRNRLQLTPDPRRLSLLADAFYWNFAEASVFQPGPDPYAGMTHPYWTPIGYWMAGAGLEWKQWLSWDRFDGAQHCWVAFAAMKRWDNQSQNYTIYRGTMGWDITRCLSGYAMGEYNDGAPYRGTWAYGGLAWKF